MPKNLGGNSAAPPHWISLYIKPGSKRFLSWDKCRGLNFALEVGPFCVATSGAQVPRGVGRGPARGPGALHMGWGPLLQGPVPGGAPNWTGGLFCLLFSFPQGVYQSLAGEVIEGKLRSRSPMEEGVQGKGRTRADTVPKKQG